MAHWRVVTHSFGDINTNAVHSQSPNTKCPQSLSIILLGDGVDLLSVVGEAIGDNLFLSRKVTPCVILVVVLDIAVKGLHPGGAVEGVIAVLGLVIHQKVTGVVVLEHRRYAVFRIGHQAVAGVVPVQLLLPGHQPSGTVARPVVEQFLSIGGILHLLQLVQRVIVVKGLTSQLTFQSAVSVAVVGVAVPGQKRVPGVDGQARQVLVQVICVLLPNEAMGYGLGRTVRVIGIGCQLLSIIGETQKSAMMKYSV